MQVINLTGSHVIASPEVEMLLKASLAQGENQNWFLCADKGEQKKKTATMGLYSFHTYEFVYPTSGF